MNKNEREIILTDNGYYWIRFKTGNNKEEQIGQYDETRNTFQIIGSAALFPVNKLDILSDIILFKTDFEMF